MSELRIAFLNALTGYGGLEIQTVRRASDAADYGCSSVIITLPGSKADILSREMDLLTENVSIRMQYFDLFAARKIAGILRKNKINILVVSKTVLLSTAILARKFYTAQCPVVLYQQMQSGIIKKDALHRWIYKNLDGAIVLTELMKKQLIETTILDPSKIKVIPYGVDIESFTLHKSPKLKEQFGLPGDKVIIGNIARIEPNKGQQTLLEAFIKLNNNDLFLVLCGHVDNQEYFTGLEKMIEQSACSERVSILGFTNKVAELLNCLDIFVLPTPSETFGLALVEAMAAGLPVVGVNSGGVPEIIDEGNNGFLFEQYDSERLSDILATLVSNPELRYKMGEIGRNKATSCYDYNTQSRLFIEALKEFHAGKT